MDMKAVGAIAMKHAKAMLIEELELVLYPALEAAAKASPTPIDDAVLMALEPAIKKYIADVLAKV